jgi:hypothetical protein
MKCEGVMNPGGESIGGRVVTGVCGGGSEAIGYRAKGDRDTTKIGDV